MLTNKITRCLKIVLLLFVFFIQVAHSQDSSIVKNKYETFSSQTGVLLKTEVEQIESVKDIGLSINTCTNIETAYSIKSLLITKNSSSFFGKVPIAEISIDWDEIKSFADALKYIKKQVDLGKPPIETSFNYRTTNGCYIAAFYNLVLGGNGWSIMLGKSYKYSGVPISGTSIELKLKNVDDLIKSIDLISKR